MCWYNDGITVHNFHSWLPVYDCLNTEIHDMTAKSIFMHIKEVALLNDSNVPQRWGAPALLALFEIQKWVFKTRSGFSPLNGNTTTNAHSPLWGKPSKQNCNFFLPALLQRHKAGGSQLISPAMRRQSEIRQWSQTHKNERWWRQQRPSLSTLLRHS